MPVDGSIRSLATRKLVGLATATALVLAAGAGSAQAYDAAPGWTASDYVAGFPHQPNGAGPVGLAFDGSGNLLVAVTETASLNKVPPGGGTADSTKLRDGYGGATGLAFDKSGRLYLARGKEHDIVELNPASGDVIRTVSSGLPCPAALATDPISGDLFVSNVFCPGGSIMRITGFANGPGVARPYAGGQDADGLTFAPDGTLFAAAGDQVLSITGTNTKKPGTVSQLATVPDADGIAFSPANGVDGDYLVVAGNDGDIDRVGLDGSVAPVVTNAGRGDLVTVGPDHCVYADLQDRVIKLGPAAGTCGFAPPVQPGVGQGGVLGERVASRMVDTSVKAKAPKTVVRGRRFTISLKVANRSGTGSHTTTLTDTLPKGVKFVRAHSAKGVSCRRHGRTLTCRRASIAARKSFTVSILLKSVSGKTYANSAKVRSTDLDPAPGNNKSRTTTKVKGRKKG
jgi:uncharacterized repeat protein (TIGR01451 family)